MKQIWKYALGAVVVAVVAVLLFSGGGTTVSADTVVNGNYSGDNVTLAHGAKLTVNGTFTLNKKLSCAAGPLQVVVNGDATINGTIQCSRDANLAAGDVAQGISLVVKGKLMFGSSAVVASNGQIQIVSDEKNLLTTQDQIDALYNSVGENSGKGPRIGPFIAGGKATALAPMRVIATASYVNPSDAPGIVFVPVANAQAQPRDNNANVVPNVVLGGHWYVGGGNPPPWLQIPTPPKGVHHIVLNFNFGNNGNVQLKDFYLAGPNGRDGTDDLGKSCNARGTKGENAFRMNVQAVDIKLDNFTLELGNGGKGGDAETLKDCDPGIATGGDGGEAGNFKMSAGGQIEIASFHIIPGTGGGGGEATAQGKDGTSACPGTKGGDATATGGNGGQNKKELAAAGAVAGIENILIDAVQGGMGGLATAKPGRGGDGTGCNCNGGKGGNGTSNGGKGGDASVTLPGGGGEANGGDGGDANSHGGNGGTGGSCGMSPSGGNGGNGGNATAKEGSGGHGTSSDGQPGSVKDEMGGDGGNGGGGCGPGGGGSGGSGNPNGNPGQPGKKSCPPLPEEHNTTNPPEGGNTTGVTPGGGTQIPGGTSGQTTPKVQVIQYQGKYIPVSELMVMTHSGCSDQPHWHSKPEPGGPVRATDGSTVYDPGPECGFGTVASTPVMQVDVPKSNY